MAHLVHFAILQHAQDLGLHRRRQIADFVEKDRPVVRRLELSLLVRDRAGERSAAMAEQLRLEQVVRDCRAVHDDQRGVPAFAVEVDGFGEQLLPGAALAFEQDGGVGLGHARRDFGHAAHRPGLGDHVGEREALGDDLAEPPVLPLQRGDVEGLSKCDAQLFPRERLRDVVEGAALHGLDRRADRPVRGEHHHRQVRLERVQTIQQLHAIAAGHLHVGHDDVDRFRRETSEARTRRYRRSRRDSRPATSWYSMRTLRKVCVVVHEQHSARRGHVATSCPRHRSRCARSDRLADRQVTSGLSCHGSRSGGRPDVPSMRRADDVLGDRQSESRPLLLGREERAEKDIGGRMLLRDAAALRPRRPARRRPGPRDARGR